MQESRIRMAVNDLFKKKEASRKIDGIATPLTGLAMTCVFGGPHE